MKNTKRYFEIKGMTELGTFEGLLSPFGNVDFGDDLVERGAYTKTLKEHGSKIPLLWFHKQWIPVGELECEEREDGLWVKGALFLDDIQAAREAYFLIKKNIVKGLSIGFKSVKDSLVNGVRLLKEVRLYEGSLVMFPMNEKAFVTSIKDAAAAAAAEKKDFNESFSQAQTLSAFYQMQGALSDALCDVIYSDLTREEKISAADTVLEQFAEAFNAFFPLYLDTLAEVYGIKDISSLEKRIDVKAAQILRDVQHPLREKILALVEGEAAPSTSQKQAATREPEPANDGHSTADALREIRDLIPR